MQGGINQNYIVQKNSINMSTKLKIKGTPTWKAESHRLQIRNQNTDKTAVDPGLKDLESSQGRSHDI